MLKQEVLTAIRIAIVFGGYDRLKHMHTVLLLLRQVVMKQAVGFGMIKEKDTAMGTKAGIAQ